MDPNCLLSHCDFLLNFWFFFATHSSDTPGTFQLACQQALTGEALQRPSIQLPFTNTMVKITKIHLLPLLTSQHVSITPTLFRCILKQVQVFFIIPAPSAHKHSTFITQRHQIMNKKTRCTFAVFQRISLLNTHNPALCSFRLLFMFCISCVFLC